MAESITIKALQDASLDAKSLEEVVNGDDARQVTTRLGETYPSVKKAIKMLFENGGLPAVPFKTKALMTASALVDGDYAQVTDDAVEDNNGLYVKNALIWEKSNYDIKELISEALYSNQKIDFMAGSLSSTGEYGYTLATATTTDFVRTYEGDSFTLKGSDKFRSSVKIFYFDNDKELVEASASYGQREYDRVFSMRDGYIKLNVEVRNLDNVRLNIDDDLLLELKNDYVLRYRKALRESAQKDIVTYRNSLNMPLEIGYIYRADTGFNAKVGGINNAQEQEVTYNFLGERRVRKFLEVEANTSFSLDFENGSAYVFEYDGNFKYLRHYDAATGDKHTLSAQAKYLKVSLENITVQHPSVKINYSSSNKDANWVYNVAQINRSWENISFTYEAYPNHGLELSEGSLVDGQYSTDRFFNSGLLKLPPNYDPKGEPVRLIVFIQGSGAYLQFTAGSMGGSYDIKDANDNSIFRYWLNEGYAIMGAYPWTTKYPMEISVNQSTPTAMAAYTQAYQWVIDNYNIRDDGVFLTSKSSGGFCAAALPVVSGIPIIANALLSPAISPMREPFGANDAIRKAYASDFGFVGDSSVLESKEGSTVVTWTPELRDYIRDNARKTIGYNPYWLGIIGENMDDLVEDAAMGLESDFELHKDRQRIYPIPIKIWMGADDIPHTIAQSKEYIQSIRNTGGTAELRTMPLGTGGHNAVDTSPDALKVSSITTKLGYVHTDIPLAIVEVIHYFRRFG